MQTLLMLFVGLSSLVALALFWLAQLKRFKLRRPRLAAWLNLLCPYLILACLWTNVLVLGSIFFLALALTLSLTTILTTSDALEDLRTARNAS